MDNRRSIFEKAEQMLVQEDDIHISIFNLLAAGGMAICFITAFYNLAMGFGLYNFLSIILVGNIFSVSMMLYTRRTKRYRRAMILTVSVIFIGLYTFIFLSSGGNHSGMPFFFILAVVFTAYMLEGILMMLMVGVLLLWYSIMFVYAYLNPLAISSAPKGRAYLTDIIFSMVIVAIALVVTIHLQVNIYRRKQKDLERAQAEAWAANRAKTEFLARMSHDVRTPLNTILAMNELIAGNTSSPDIKGWISDSDHSAQILLSLVNDMLDISSIEAGKTVLHTVPYSTSKLINEIIKAWKYQVMRAGLHFDVQADPEIPRELTGDRIAIRKIVDNLMSNAVKYTDSGSITMEVLFDRDESTLIIRISDTGCGIEPRNLERIFLPFERGIGDESGISGNGLGLAIVRELTEYMNGIVTVNSKIGDGTTFTVRLPQTINQEETAGPLDFCDTGPEKDNTENVLMIAPGVRILVVDDNLYNRKVIGQLLEPLLVQVDDVESGIEALEMIDIRHYDLILMDLRMPRMDGIETGMRIREEYPEFDTPIVILTAEILGNVEEYVLDNGFAGYIAKPVRSAQLADMLQSLLPDRFIPATEFVEKSLTEEEISGWKDRLLPYGIELSAAFEYCAGNSGEFVMRMNLFAAYSGDTIRRIHSAEGTPDYYIHVHALKSEARGVGAILLADLAAAVELRQDPEYDVAAMGLISAEYQRVMEGVHVFLLDKNIQ